MSWDDLAGSITLTDSPLEARRFGLSFARLAIGRSASTSEAHRATELLVDSEADVVVARWTAGVTAWPLAFLRSGRTVLPADQLTYWEVPAGKVRHPDADDLLTVTDGSAGDASSALSSTIATSFHDYGSHYAANPLLDRELALAGYQEWASRTLTETPENVFVLRNGDRPVGVATTELAQDGADLEVLLAGLTPQAQGHGWYGHLLAAIDEHAVHSGSQRVIISTQTHNHRVQRAWARAGMVPFDTIQTAHAVRAGLLP